ncbi:MAG: hypothetical protein ACR2NV_12095 [Thermoleophilaceae bacterium]
MPGSAAASLAAWLERRGGALAAALALLVLAAGVAYSVVLGPAPRFPDEVEYLRLAESLASGAGLSLDGVRPTAFRPPGYPAALAPVIALGGGPVAARALNFALLAGAMGLAWLVLHRRGHPVAAGLAPVLMAGYPVLFYTAGTIYPQTLALLGVMALVLMLGTEAPGVALGALAGLLAGATALTVPTLVFLVPVAVVWLAARAGAGRRLAVGVLCLLVAAVTIGAWSVRNVQAVGAPVFVSTNSGYNLVLGNAERTSPNAGVNADVRREIAPAARLDEVERDVYLRDRALEWVVRNPDRAARLYALKVLNHFNYRNELRTSSRASALADVAVALTYGALLLIVLARLALALARRAPLSAFEGLLLAIYALSALATAVAFTRIRFRVPFDPLLAMLAALALERALEWWLPQRRPSADARTDAT